MCKTMSCMQQHVGPSITLVGVQFAADPEAYGVNNTAQQPCLARMQSVISSTESETSDSSSGNSEAQYPCRLSHRRPRRVQKDCPVRRVRSVVVPVLAVGAAILVTRHSSKAK